MIAQILTFVATVATAGIIVRARPAVRHTTLTGAWTWASVAAVSWCVAAAASLVASGVLVEQLWYLAAVLTLCPWIAVLGARRPTVRVWNWFVVLPLLAVLLWPVALLWMPRGPDRMSLAAPHLIGFATVTLMGTGNYLGTRFSLPAVLTFLAEGLLLTGLSRQEFAEGQRWLAVVPAIVQCTAVWSAALLSRDRVRPSGWNGVWAEFRNTFGVVWANRIAERINSEAVRGNWALRLQPGGFVSVETGEPVEVPPDSPHVDHALRWLLRRFVDEEWISGRLHAGRGSAPGPV